jgi:AcrR family transcriptional regulator
MATDSGPPREDPRVTRSKASVLATTLDLLRAGGMSCVSIERIAADSGAAKTTIYRHWAGRDELVFAALESLMEHTPFATTTSLHDDLLSGLTHLAEGLAMSVWAEVLPSMIQAAEHDDHLRELATEFAARRRSGLEQRLRHAVAIGELSAAAEAEVLASELVGPLFYRRFLSRQPITTAFIEGHVETILRGAGPPVAEQV